MTPAAGLPRENEADGDRPMIRYLEGKLVAKAPTQLVVDVGGVGFHVEIPVSSFEAFPEPGDKATVLTHLHVREDVLALYGFATEVEREVFELLISVSGIGPPMAQRILSGVSIADFRRQVAAEDVKGLTRIKGVGQKLAQRLVVELRDRIGSIDAAEPGTDVDPESVDQLEEAVLALVGLGSNPLQARKVVAQVLKDDGDGMPVEELIKRALKATR